MFGEPNDTEQTMEDTVTCLKKISYGEYRSKKFLAVFRSLALVYMTSAKKQDV